MPPTSPLPLKRRADLQEVPMQFRGVRCWTIKDPVAGRFFQLRDEERFVLEQLRQPVTLAELRDRVNARFAPRRVDARQLHGFLSLLHREGLTVSSGAGQAERLLDDAATRLGRERRQRWTNPLAIRFRGIQPERLLAWLTPRAGWLFSPLAHRLGLLWILATLATAVAWRAEVAARLPDFQTFFQLRYALAMAVAFGVVKVLHELGHGVACVREGGRCHELGLMLLVLIPCLYCNVSDAWLLPDKRKRMAVSFAGIWVELLLAAACFWVWWLAEPGLLRAMALCLAVVCSVNTVVFNGNPLLRYDGYFVLADWVEIPNLYQESRTRLQRLAADKAFGLQVAGPGPRFPSPPWLLGYAVASLCYRWMVLGGILWLVHLRLKPLGLGFLSAALAALVLGAIAVRAAAQLAMFLKDPVRDRSMSLVRTSITTTIAGLLAAGAFLFPIPARVSAPLILRPLDSQPVFVAVAGRLTEGVQEGQTVGQGERIGQLENRELERKRIAAAGDREVQQQRVASLEQRAARDERLAGELRVAREVLEQLTRQLAQLEKDCSQLELLAPRAGRVYGPGRRAGELPTGAWSGTPLEAPNRGVRLDSGDLLCVVGDPSQMEAMLVVQQSDVGRVRAGQDVELLLDSAPRAPIAGRVLEVSEVEQDAPPEDLVRAGLLPGRVAENGRIQLPVPAFVVRVELLSSRPLAPGLAGRARIQVAAATLAQRVRRAWGAAFGLP